MSQGTFAKARRTGGMLSIAFGFWLFTSLPLTAQTDTAPQFVPVPEYVQLVVDTIKARQSRMVGRYDTASILNDINFLNDGVKYEAGDLRTRCYFDFGDLDRFASLVAGGLTGGVVVDTPYIQAVAGDAAALYQNVNTLSVAFSNMEAKYNGFIILKAYVTQPEQKLVQSSYGTYVHEAVHSAAFAAGRTDLDVDEKWETGGIGGAPEYLGYYFFLEQLAIAEAERRALDETREAFLALQGALQGKKPEEDKDLFNQAVKDFMIRTASAAEDFLREVKAAYADTEVSYIAEDTVTMMLDRQMARELIALWGGRADWDRLLADAEGHVSTLQRFRETDDVDQGLPPYFESLFSFFFKKSCLDN